MVKFLEFQISQKKKLFEIKVLEISNFSSNVAPFSVDLWNQLYIFQNSH